jgi:SAM-dependent methyltransferase
MVLTPSRGRQAYAVGLRAYRLYRLYSAPERVRMRSAVRRWIALSPSGSKILEVGGGTSMLRSMIEATVPDARYMSGDIAPTNNSTLVLDACALPMRDASIDVVLALEVLEHIPQPMAMLSEVSRVLTDDGMLILTTPFMFGVHDYRDYFRYTPRGLSELLEGTGMTLDEVVLRGGTFVSAAGLLRNLIRDAIVGDPAGWRAQGSRKKALWALATFVMIPWVPVMWLALGVDRSIDRDSKSPPGYFFLVRKTPASVVGGQGGSDEDQQDGEGLVEGG